MAGEHNSNLIELYKSKAHVFQIDQATMTSWQELGIDSAKRAERTKLKDPEPGIPISFVASILNGDTTNQSSRRELKIIAIGENGDKVLDTTILPDTNFKKRSVKFGQWEEPYTKNVYGLGFGSEAELTDFIETFQQLQKDILSEPLSSYNQQPQHRPDSSQSQTTPRGDRQSWNQQHLNNISETNGSYQSSKPSTNTTQQFSNTLTHPSHQQQQFKRQQQQAQTKTTNGNTSPTNNSSGPSNNLTGYPRSQSMAGLQAKATTNNNPNSRWSETENFPVSQTEWHGLEQVKYENERLKQALEESSKNAGVWHNELLNLRTNNVKLTEALQESKSNVEEWGRQMLSLRNENKELKLRVLANESDDGNEINKDQRYKNYVDEVQSTFRRKDDEIEELQRAMQEMELELKAQSSRQNGQMNESTSTQFILSPQHRQDFEVIIAKFESKVKGLTDVLKEFKLLLHSI